MFIKQLYTGCLSEAAYYVESNGEAAIIDPMRDIDEYLQLANERKTKIKYIFETHFHADFVSGHIDLSEATGAPIVYGPGTETRFPVHIAKDEEIFKIGDLTIEVLHTPGHTLESACYLLKDENKKDYCVFTGDTLFVGDVGRPDLAQNINEVLQQGMKAMTISEFKKMIDDDTVILDTRDADTFTQGFVPGSINIGLEGRFAEWAGSLLPFDAPILLITEPGMEKESIIRLARVGFDKVIGHLAGG